MSQRTIYDYYDIKVPDDLGDEGARLEVAFLEARERARLYVTPCQWNAWVIDEQTVRVRRTRKGTARTRHYHVLQGMRGGYLPNLNWVCTTRAEAEASAVSLAQEWRDEWAEDEAGKWKPVWRVAGSARQGRYDIAHRDPSPTELGYYIQITTCDEPDCLKAIEGGVR